MSNQLDIFQSRIEAYRMPTVYHNTTVKKGPELEAAQVKASKQTEAILKVFHNHPHTSFTPWDVYNHLGQQMMITSVRRAITTLTDAGHLVKTEERRKSGPANETSFCWKLNR